MLGHLHRIEGAVIRGDQRGRELGYPTANMSIAGLHPPKFGVYAVEADVLTGPHAGRYAAVASLGVRPMFGVNQPNLETHLFDFKGDLYGAHLSVALVEFLRPEATFDSLDALIAQMDRDSAEARRILAERRHDRASSAANTPGWGGGQEGDRPAGGDIPRRTPRP
jgi:riboflavin kinase / FMN adenylyltransferase